MIDRVYCNQCHDLINFKNLRNIIEGNDSCISPKQFAQNSMDKGNSMIANGHLSGNDSDLQKMKDMIQEQNSMMNKQNKLICQLFNKLNQ